MIKTKISIFLFLIFVSFQSIAQEKLTIERSTKIEVIDGQRYYIHTVEKGQTAYSISKAYGVSLQDIYSHNPGSDQGLLLDQVLRIPVVSKVVEKESTPKDSLASNKKFIYHYVEKGETLYHICKLYNVNPDVLVSYNPGLTSDLHPGDVIKIPTQEKLISEKAKALYPSVFDYKVKKRDNYYRLHRKYKVSQEQLEQLNPELKTSGLQKGMIIQIPKGLKKLDTIPEYVEIVADSVILVENDTMVPDTSMIVAIDCDSMQQKTDTFHIALMIPFYSDLEGEIKSSNALYSKGAKAYKSFQFIQFYEGFLMAVDSIKQLGFNAEVYIYDTKGDTAETRNITNKPEFKSLDLVIGPLFHENVKIVLDASKGSKTKVVSPFSRKTEFIESSPNLFKIMPGVGSMVRGTCKWISDSLPNSRIILLHDGTDDELAMLEMIKESFNMYAGSGIDTNEIFIYSYANADSEKYISKLSNQRKNILINLSNNEAKISNFVRELDRKRKDYEIYLVGSELSWVRFKTLEIRYLVDLHLTLCSSSFIDPLDSTVQQFETRFIAKYKTLPQPIAYRSFDISWFFMNSLLNYGTNFENCFNKLSLHTMTTKFQFEQKGFGFYENTYLNMYQYNDYKLVNKKQP